MGRPGVQRHLDLADIAVRGYASRGGGKCWHLVTTQHSNRPSELYVWPTFYAPCGARVETRGMLLAAQDNNSYLKLPSEDLPMCRCCAGSSIEVSRIRVKETDTAAWALAQSEITVLFKNLFPEQPLCIGDLEPAQA